MIRRSALPMMLLLAACQPSVPDSGAGVGFQDYNSYIRNTYAPPPAATPAPVAPAGGFDPAAASAAIDRAQGTAAPAATAPLSPTPVDITAQPAVRPRGNAPDGIKEDTGEMTAGHAGISDEQDFAAVSSRETIASDKERIAENRAKYVVVQPKDLPQRPGDTGPNIVEFALATTHDPGTQLYSRSKFGAKNVNVACAKYASPDLAMQDFLARGGPDRDRLGLDPDGDGFACGWDPRPFRTALQ
ncbi:MAG: hypothetical protein R3D63_03890 [Paracoccaceae bacterium]